MLFLLQNATYLFVASIDVNVGFRYLFYKGKYRRSLQIFYQFHRHCQIGFIELKRLWIAVLQFCVQQGGRP